MQTCVQYGRQVSNNNTSTAGAMRVREFVTSVLKTSSARGLFLRNPRLRRHLGASVLKVRMKQKTTFEGIFTKQGDQARHEAAERTAGVISIYTEPTGGQWVSYPGLATARPVPHNQAAGGDHAHPQQHDHPAVARIPPTVQEVGPRPFEHRRRAGARALRSVHDMPCLGHNDGTDIQ